MPAHSCIVWLLAVQLSPLVWRLLPPLDQRNCSLPAQQICYMLLAVTELAIHLHTVCSFGLAGGKRRCTTRPFLHVQFTELQLQCLVVVLL